MQNIAGHCQQSFCIQKFVDNTQQCFAFTLFPHSKSCQYPLIIHLETLWTCKSWLIMFNGAMQIQNPNGTKTLRTFWTYMFSIIFFMFIFHVIVQVFYRLIKYLGMTDWTRKSTSKNLSFSFTCHGNTMFIQFMQFQYSKCRIRFFTFVAWVIFANILMIFSKMLVIFFNCFTKNLWMAHTAIVAFFWI